MVPGPAPTAVDADTAQEYHVPGVKVVTVIFRFVVGGKEVELQESV